MATEYAELIALVNKANTAQKAAFVEADLTLDTIATATGAQNTTAVLPSKTHKREGLGPLFFLPLLLSTEVQVVHVTDTRTPTVDEVFLGRGLLGESHVVVPL